MTNHLSEHDRTGGSIIPIGDTLIITSKKLELEEARREIRKIMESCGVSFGVLLAGLREEREKLYKEAHGGKKG